MPCFCDTGTRLFAHGRFENAQVAKQDTKHVARDDGRCCRRLAAALLAPAPAAHAQDKTFTMKLSHRHHQRHPARMAQALRGAGRKELRRPHQGRDLSGEPARLDPAPDRRRAVRLDPGLDGPAGVPGRRRRAVRGAERARPVLQRRSGHEGDAGPAGPKDDLRLRRGRRAWSASALRRSGRRRSCPRSRSPSSPTSRA